MRSMRLIYTAAEAAIIVCALRFDDGGGGRDNLLRGALGGDLMREIGSRREGWNTRCSWIENTRLGAAQSSTFRDGPAAD